MQINISKSIVPRSIHPSSIYSWAWLTTLFPCASAKSPANAAPSPEQLLGGHACVSSVPSARLHRTFVSADSVTEMLCVTSFRHVSEGPGVLFPEIFSYLYSPRLCVWGFVAGACFLPFFLFSRISPLNSARHSRICHMETQHDGLTPGENIFIGYTGSSISFCNLPNEVREMTLADFRAKISGCFVWKGGKYAGRSMQMIVWVGQLCKGGPDLLVFKPKRLFSI